jgi:hypothetical protein
MPPTPTRSLLALAGALALTPACSSSSNEDSTSPTGDASSCAVTKLDAGFTTLAQLCETTPASSTPLLQDACGPYLLVTRGTSAATVWYFDIQSGALVAIVDGGSCTTSQSSFASQWGDQAWGCATATPACTAEAGASHD